MVNFELLIYKQRLHTQLHAWRTVNINQISIDPSCPICYPEHIIPDTHRFLNFWDWFSSEYPVICYTSNTKHQLNRLLNSNQPEAILGRIELLVLSI
jgi:hypothetical protein